MGKSVDYPKPPDPYATAQAQGDINRDTAVDQTRLNAMNQYTPFGSLTYSEQPGATTRQFDQHAYDIALADWERQLKDSPQSYWDEQELRWVYPSAGQTAPMPDRDAFYYDEQGVPRFSATQTLSPEQQNIYDQTVGIQNDLLGIGQSQLDRVSGAMSRPMSMANLPSLQVPLRGVGPVGQASYIGDPNQNRASIGDAGQVQSQFDPGGDIMQRVGINQNRASIGDAGQIERGFDAGGPIRTNLPIDLRRAGIGDTYGIQKGVGADDFGDDRQRVEQALVARMQPYLDQRRDQQRTSLVNQGFSDTASEGYSSAMDEVTRQENDAYLAAIAQAGQEQSRLFGMDLAAGQFANQAAAQDYSQTAGRAAFDNANIDANLNARLAQRQFANQAAAQQYAQNAGQAQFANAAQAQAFQQNAERSAFENANIDANLAARLAQQASNNQAVGQQYAQNAGQAQFANAAQAQAFQQQAGRAAFDNANIDAIYQQMLAQQAGNNQAQGQRFAQEVTRANADQARAAAINAARQQAIQERVMQRQMPINELSAFLSQSQLQAPQFASTPQTAIAAPNYQDAAFAAYNGQMAQAQAQAQQNAALTQGLFSLGGAGLGAFGAINPFGWGAAPAA